MYLYSNLQISWVKSFFCSKSFFFHQTSIIKEMIFSLNDIFSTTSSRKRIILLCNSVWISLLNCWIRPNLILLNVAQTNEFKILSDACTNNLQLRLLAVSSIYIHTIYINFFASIKRIIIMKFTNSICVEKGSSKICEQYACVIQTKLYHANSGS